VRPTRESLRIRVEQQKSEFGVPAAESNGSAETRPARITAKRQSWILRQTRMTETQPESHASLFEDFLPQGFASAHQLKAIPAERASTIQTTIQKTFEKRGHPPAASMAPVSANGKGKAECCHLIISKVVVTLVHNFIDGDPKVKLEFRFA
jgi:hypothetical protein